MFLSTVNVNCLKSLISFFISSGENLGLESKYFKKKDDSIPLRGLSQNTLNSGMCVWKESNKTLFEMYLRGNNSSDSMNTILFLLFYRVLETLLPNKSPTVTNSCSNNSLSVFSWIADRMLKNFLLTVWGIWRCPVLTTYS